MAANSAAVLIVGAGVVGRSIAYYLCRRGVTAHLIDENEGPSATSRASLGILTHPNGLDNPYSNLYRDGHACHQQLAAELLEETAMDVGWRTPGGIDLILNDTDEEAARELLRFNQERACAAEWVEAEQLRDMEPDIAPQVRGGVYFADDYRVDPALLSEALLQAVQQRGGRVSYGEKVEAVEPTGSNGVEVRTNKGTHTADYAVLAAGAWTGVIGQMLGVGIAVRPVRGQHGRYVGGERVNHILRHSGHYIVAAGKDIIVGATVEEVGFTLENTEVAAQHFDEMFCALLGFAPQRVEQRAGLRPKPKGGRPLIGPLQAYPRIFVAAGHYKNGVLLGPVTGQVVSEWIATGQAGRDMSYFAPER